MGISTLIKWITLHAVVGAEEAERPVEREDEALDEHEVGDDHGAVVHLDCREDHDCKVNTKCVTTPSMLGTTERQLKQPFGYIYADNTDSAARGSGAEEAERPIERRIKPWMSTKSATTMVPLFISIAEMIINDNGSGT